MKLYYITDIILDERLAPTIHVNEICSNLAMLGNEVILYAPNISEFTSSKKYEIRLLKTPPWLVSVFYQSNLLIHLWRDLRTNRPEVIYMRQSQLLFVPTVMARLFGIPLILEVNGRLIDEAQQIKTMSNRILLVSGIFTFLERFNFNSASKIIVVSLGIKNYIVKTYGVEANNIAALSNGVDTEAFRPSALSKARAELHLVSDAVYVGYIGSLHSWQGLRYVANAAKIVCNRRPNAKFLIVGNGGDEEYLSQFIRENHLEQSVGLHPAVAHELIPNYINALDICLSYPLKVRGGAASPFKVYEYLSCGKSVVVSDIGGIREEFGSVVSYADAESPSVLADTLLALIDHKEIRESIGISGRKFIEQGHSWRVVAERIISICQFAKASPK